MGDQNDLADTNIIGLKTLLTNEEIALAAEKINEKALKEDDPCLVCGSQTWIMPSLTTVYVGQNKETGAEDAFQCVTVICTTCGHLRQFAAAYLGIDVYLRKDAGAQDAGS